MNNRLKIFNIYKAGTSFATKLIDAFIPLIIYQHSNNLFFALGYLVLDKFLILLLRSCLKKQLEKNPQIFIICRIFPIILFQVCLAFIQINVIAFGIATCIFHALSEVFRTYPQECLFNYSSISTNNSSNGIDRLIEYSSYAIASLCGAFILQHINQYILVIISLSIYIIACMPMLIHYIKNHKKRGYNIDLISNATMTLKNDNLKETKELQKHLTLRYFIYYILISCLDTATEVLPLFLYVKYHNFSYAGYFSTIESFMFGLGSFITSLLYKKYELSKYVIASIIIVGCGFATYPFIMNNIIAFYIIFIIIKFFYGSFSLYIYQKMYEKSRILGICNNALYTKGSADLVGKQFGNWICFALNASRLCYLGLLGAFAMLILSIYLPKSEEMTRREIVDYIQSNDIKLSKLKKTRKKRKNNDKNNS